MTITSDGESRVSWDRTRNVGMLMRMELSAFRVMKLPVRGTIVVVQTRSTPRVFPLVAWRITVSEPHSQNMITTNTIMLVQNGLGGSFDVVKLEKGEPCHRVEWFDKFDVLQTPVLRKVLSNLLLIPCQRSYGLQPSNKYAERIYASLIGDILEWSSRNIDTGFILLRGAP